MSSSVASPCTTVSMCGQSKALTCAGGVTRPDPLQAASSRRSARGPGPAGRGGLPHHHQVRHPAQDQGWEILGGRAVQKVVLICGITGLNQLQAMHQQCTADDITLHGSSSLYLSWGSTTPCTSSCGGEACAAGLVRIVGPGALEEVLSHVLQVHPCCRGVCHRHCN